MLIFLSINFIYVKKFDFTIDVLYKMNPKGLLLKLEKAGGVEFCTAEITLDGMLKPLLRGIYQKSNDRPLIEVKYLFENNSWKLVYHTDTDNY